MPQVFISSVLEVVELTRNKFDAAADADEDEDEDDSFGTCKRSLAALVLVVWRNVLPVAEDDCRPLELGGSAASLNEAEFKASDLIPTGVATEGAVESAAVVHIVPLNEGCSEGFVDEFAAIVNAVLVEELWVVSESALPNGPLDPNGSFETALINPLSVLIMLTSSRSTSPTALPNGTPDIVILLFFPPSEMPPD